MRTRTCARKARTNKKNRESERIVRSSRSVLQVAAMQHGVVRGGIARVRDDELARFELEAKARKGELVRLRTHGTRERESQVRIGVHRQASGRGCLREAVDHHSGGARDLPRARLAPG